MKLYLVSRTDHIGGDEYDAKVVRARDKEHALEVARGAQNSYHRSEFETYNTTITALTHAGEPEVILGSFNAG